MGIIAEGYACGLDAVSMATDSHGAFPGNGQAAGDIDHAVDRFIAGHIHGDIAIDLQGDDFCIRVAYIAAQVEDIFPRIITNIDKATHKIQIRTGDLTTHDPDGISGQAAIAITDLQMIIAVAGAVPAFADGTPITHTGMALGFIHGVGIGVCFAVNFAAEVADLAAVAGGLVLVLLGGVILGHHITAGADQRVLGIGDSVGGIGNIFVVAGDGDGHALGGGVIMVAVADHLVVHGVVANILANRNIPAPNGVVHAVLHSAAGSGTCGDQSLFTAIVGQIGNRFGSRGDGSRHLVNGQGKRVRTGRFGVVVLCGDTCGNFVSACIDGQTVTAGSAVVGVADGAVVGLAVHQCHSGSRDSCRRAGVVHTCSGAIPCNGGGCLFDGKG